MQVKTTVPAAPYAVQSALETIKTHMAAKSAVTPNVRTAAEVPVGGMFKYDGGFWIRTTGKGRKTYEDFMTLERACRAVNLTTGAVIGLDRALVEYFPSASVSVA